MQKKPIVSRELVELVKDELIRMLVLNDMATAIAEELRKDKGFRDLLEMYYGLKFKPEAIRKLRRKK